MFQLHLGLISHVLQDLSRKAFPIAFVPSSGNRGYSRNQTIFVVKTLNLSEDLTLLVFFLYITGNKRCILIARKTFKHLNIYFYKLIDLC